MDLSFISAVQHLHILKEDQSLNPQGQAIIERANRSLKEELTGVTFPESKRDPYLASQVNFLFFDEKGLSFAYKHWAFLPRDTALPLVRWKDPITSQWHVPALLLAKDKVMLVIPPQDTTDPIWVPLRDICLPTDQG